MNTLEKQWGNVITGGAQPPMRNFMPMVPMAGMVTNPLLWALRGVLDHHRWPMAESGWDFDTSRAWTWVTFSPDSPGDGFGDALPGASLAKLTLVFDFARKKLVGESEGLPLPLRFEIPLQKALSMSAMRLSGLISRSL